jgi:formyl-CoA transferase
VRNREILVPILADMVRLQGKQQWIATLEATGVPCGPINDLGEVFENEQVVARGLQVDLPHPSGGTVKLVRNPINMTGTPPEALAHPPTLGEHTETILRDVLGYDEVRIAALRRQSVI